MTTLTEHDVELAIAPLETLLSEDLGLAAAAVNDWLHGISGGLLDLQTLRNLGENTLSLPTPWPRWMCWLTSSSWSSTLAATRRCGPAWVST
jgi:hypothetical protein